MIEPKDLYVQQSNHSTSSHLVIQNSVEKIQPLDNFNTYDSKNLHLRHSNPLISSHLLISSSDELLSENVQLSNREVNKTVPITTGCYYV